MIDYLKRIILPLLLGTVLVSMTLYIYNSPQIIPLTLASFVIQAALLALLGVLRKRKILGTLIYIILCFAVLFIIINFWFMSFGGKAPMSFTAWFYGAQGAETYFLPFTLIILIGFSFLFASAMYYFTQVTYRSVMILLCSLIPFAVYAKRYENPSWVYISLVLILFLTLMIHYRHITEPSVKIISDRAYWLSVGLYVGAIILVTMLIPKFEVTPLRQKFDDMVAAMEGNVNAGNTTNAGFISDVSAGSGFDDDTTGEIYYYVSAKEPLYLKIQTYDNYIGERKWSVSSDYTTYYANWENRYSFYNPQYLMEAAKEYRDSASDPMLPDIVTYSVGDNTKYADIIPNNYPSAYIFSTNSTFKITDIDGLDKETYINETGGILVDTNTLYEDKYKIEYYSENISRLKGASKFADEFESLSEYLSYCDLIRNSEEVSERSRNIAEKFYKQADNALEYYDATYTPASEEIRELAFEITEGCTSDYEKASAIQNYFLTSGYEYDARFKASDKSIESFIFSDKRGICADYATAMTILAREVGLPARYTVGFNMSEEISDDFYAVRDNDAHAFTEVFISGYGWMTFDATPASAENNDNNGGGNGASTTETITLTAILVFAGVLLAVMIILLFPTISECVFSIGFSLSSGKKAVIMLYKRTGKLMEKKIDFSSKASSSNELGDYAASAFGTDISAICILADSVLYGGRKADKKQLALAFGSYKALRKAVKAKKKEK